MDFIFKAWDFLQGKKTYIIGALTLAYAILGLCIGQIEADSAVILIASACSALGLRAGIANK
jgi:hypothetical protein